MNTTSSLTANQPNIRRKILITGGTRGLGLETAKVFGKRGAFVYLTYRSDETQAQEACAALEREGISSKAFCCDLSEEGSIDRLFDQIEKETDRLDAYIHNAAATSFKPLLDIKAHHIDKTLNITVKGFILGVQRAVRLMAEGGAIVSISGMDTLKAVPRHGLLGAAKSALETLTAYYAHELASKKIRVNGVNPGFLDTDSTRKYLGPAFDQAFRQYLQFIPSRRPPQLVEIAQVVWFLCSEEAKWVVGQTLCVDGGANFALPMG